MPQLFSCGNLQRCQRLCMRAVVGVIIALTFHPSPSVAQELARTVRLTVDNDYFDFWLPPMQRPDNNYSQGARLSWDIASVPGFGRRILCGHRQGCGTTIEAGQEIYTPTHDATLPLPGERPYAGWLYGRVAIRAADKRTARSVALTIGVTGPPSLAEPTQSQFHRLFGFRWPLGWGHQLATEPAFALAADHSWRIAPSGPAERLMDFVPTIGATVGTLRTAASAGGRARVGTGLDHPWLVREGANRAALYGFVGARVEGVARDLFLDGSTFRSSAHVEREAMRSEWERGLGIGIGQFAAEYRVVSQSREYRSGPSTHTYGSLSASWTFRSAQIR